MSSGRGSGDGHAAAGGLVGRKDVGVGLQEAELVDVPPGLDGRDGRPVLPAPHLRGGGQSFAGTRGGRAGGSRPPPQFSGWE